MIGSPYIHSKSSLTIFFFLPLLHVLVNRPVVTSCNACNHCGVAGQCRYSEGVGWGATCRRQPHAALVESIKLWVTRSHNLSLIKLNFPLKEAEFEPLDETESQQETPDQKDLVRKKRKRRPCSNQAVCFGVNVILLHTCVP